MKEAFDSYFEKLYEASRKEGRNYPKTVYLEKCDVENGVYIPICVNFKEFLSTNDANVREYIVPVSYSFVFIRAIR